MLVSFLESLGHEQEEREATREPLDIRELCVSNQKEREQLPELIASDSDARG
jgi:hypothetical protein